MWVYSVSIVSVLFVIRIYPLNRFDDVNVADIIRHVLPDLVVLIISVISLLLLIYMAIWKKHSSSREQISSRQHLPKNTRPISSLHSINSEHASSHEHQTSIREQLEKCKEILILQPTSSTYFVTTWNFTFIFLLWLSGVCTASVLNFPYFITSLCLALCWALHLNQTKRFLITQRIIIILITLYSFIHLILLYVYQLQSAQDLVSRSSVTARFVCAYLYMSC